jgi:hypothetical protein
MLLHDHRLCLGPWSEHSTRTTGGNYACNRYESAKEQGLVCSLLDIILLCIEEGFDPDGSLLLHATQCCSSLSLHFVVGLPVYFIFLV